MSDSKDTVSSVQRWFRDYAGNLASSYRSSGRLKHCVTKGESREYQVLHFLRGLLPQRRAVVSNAVIIDWQDRQTKKFDGVLVDRSSWPMLLAEEGGVTVVPVESVAVALEVKSRLDSREIEDIFAKTGSICDLAGQSVSPRGATPKTATFSYACKNPSLAFLDFAVRVHQRGFRSPNAVCILGSSVMALAPRNGALTLTDDWTANSMPVLISCGDDALCLFFYLLTYWITDDASRMSLFARYLHAAFARADAFFFEADFLDRVGTSTGDLDRARQTFKGQAGVPIAKLYAQARRALKLR